MGNDKTLKKVMELFIKSRDMNLVMSCFEKKRQSSNNFFADKKSEFITESKDIFQIFNDCIFSNLEFKNCINV